MRILSRPQAVCSCWNRRALVADWISSLKEFTLAGRQALSVIEQQM